MHNFSTQKLIFPVTLLIFSIYFLFSAWVADDAYITFRTVENFHQGYGLRWNIIERVQSYTHPLWMINLLIGKLFISDIYYLSLLLSFTYSTLTLYILYILTDRNPSYFLLFFLLFISSKSVLDFTSSGLENSLSYFLIASFFYSLLRLRNYKYFYLITSIILSCMFLNRMDLIIAFLPIAIYLYFYQSIKINKLRKSLWQGFLGFLPVVFWSLFAIYYYGSFFANSVIAKTNTGLPLVILQGQGIQFLYANLIYEPYTIIFITITALCFIFSKNIYSKLLAIGIVLYILYVVNVGGDYMYGRFLTTPFIISLFLLTTYIKQASHTFTRIIFFTSICLAIFNLYQYTIKYISSFEMNSTGFTDERAFYYRTTGLLPNLLNQNISIADHFSETVTMFDSELADNDPVLLYNMGFNGYIASQVFPEKYIVDSLGLTNAYLAAHPINYGYWRIGHFRREPSLGYINSIKLNRNVLSSTHDHYVYEQVKLLSQAPLNEKHRFKAIINWHNGTTFAAAEKAFAEYPHDLLINHSQADFKNYWYPKYK